MHDSPDISLRRGPLIARHSLVFLVFFYFAAAIVGLRAIWPRPSLLDELVPLSVTFCLAVWALEDDARRHCRIPLLSRPWFLVFAGILVPGYVVWSRGWSGVGWVVLHVFGFIATVVVAGIAELFLLRLR